MVSYTLPVILGDTGDQLAAVLATSPLFRHARRIWGAYQACEDSLEQGVHMRCQSTGQWAVMFVDLAMTNEQLVAMHQALQVYAPGAKIVSAVEFSFRWDFYG